MSVGSVDAVVFDVGMVLIEWDPRHVYRKIFTRDDGSPDEDRVDWFLGTVCTMEWNIRQDLGRSIAEANAEACERHPDWKDEIAAYYGRFQEMIPGPIEGTVAAMRALKARGVKVPGLTNFGRETFAETAKRFDFLNEFDGVVVSGEEGVIKPDPAIFELLAERCGLVPGRTLFVDDSAKNIESAGRLGFYTHHFTRGPDALRADLVALGLL